MRRYSTDHPLSLFTFPIQPVCRHPVAGECCPQCGGDCLYEEVQYRNNQVFARPEECQECHCREGSVYCQRKSCPHAPCRHPVEEDCCPHCEDCRFLGEVHSNGERFTHPTDTCKQCTCQVSCTTHICICEDILWKNIFANFIHPN